MWNLLCSFRILSHPRDHSGNSMSTAWIYLDCFKKSYQLFWIEFGFSIYKIPNNFSSLLGNTYIYYNLHFFFIRRMNYSDAIKYLKEHDIKKEDGTYYEFGEVSNFIRLLSKNLRHLILISSWYVHSSEDPPHRVSKLFSMCIPLSILRAAW